MCTQEFRKALDLAKSDLRRTGYAGDDEYAPTTAAQENNALKAYVQQLNNSLNDFVYEYKKLQQEYHQLVSLLTKFCIGLCLLVGWFVMWHVLMLQPEN